MDAALRDDGALSANFLREILFVATHISSVAGLGKECIGMHAAAPCVVLPVAGMRCAIPSFIAES